jgi:hypothetical protein
MSTSELLMSEQRDKLWHFPTVIPAKAGIQCAERWIPASAGMTRGNGLDVRSRISK